MAKVRLKKQISSIAYSGSLCQQGYSESLKKGYNLWTIDRQNVDHIRRIIPNDYGWAKITIARGEDIEARIDNIQFSNNKRKTKVHIVYEDYEENYSMERLMQIKQMVKDKFGCESVHVEFREMEREVLSPLDQSNDEVDPDDIESMFRLFLDENEFDLADEDEKREMIDFAMKMEKEIDAPVAHGGSRRYTLVSTEISNIFTFPVEPTMVEWNTLHGITGIFGDNYCGKSNLLKALVWGMFQHIMGGAHQKYLVNIYTGSDKGYVKNVYDIDGVLFRSIREVHKGKSSNSYPTKFEVFRDVRDENGHVEQQWCSTLSDNTTAENNEVKKMITEALGNYDDFMKISMHAQNERDGYLSLDQQEKNDLIARYLNLQAYRDRFDYVKKPYNELRAKQKLLGEAVDIELEVKDIQRQSDEKDLAHKAKAEEQVLWKQKQEDAERKVLELTRKLSKIENIGYDNKEAILRDAQTKEKSIQDLRILSVALEEFLAVNIAKELDIDPKRTMDVLERESAELERVYALEANKWKNIDAWLKANSTKEVPQINTEEIAKEVDALNKSLHDHQNVKIACQGKTCPTCKQSIKAADPVMEAQMDAMIIEVSATIKRHKESLEAYSGALSWNKEVQTNMTVLRSLEDTIKSRRLVRTALTTEMERVKNSSTLIELNKTIEKKRDELKKLNQVIEVHQNDLTKLQEKAVKFDAVQAVKDANIVIEKEIESLEGLIRSYKSAIHTQQTELTSLVSDLRVLSNSLTDKKKKLQEVKTGDKTYKMYSIYLQAVDRGGIPAMIIKKKLPLVNNKVNSVLQSIVDFKMELSIDMKGNITELLYNAENKWDALPLNIASGSQQFISSIALKDALNYISKRAIVQPSIIMIDEGFGTLDENHRGGVMDMLEYLKVKYQNVIIITHLNEVKEGADHIIEATRDTSVLSKSVRDNNAKAGITRLTVQR